MPVRLAKRFSVTRWLVFSTLLVGLAAALGSVGGLGRADLALTDSLRLFDSRPHRDDIVVIALDDASLDALGPLPWNESVYERLFDTVAEGQPRVLGMLIPWNRRFLSPRADERVLADAVARVRNVVLPVPMTGARGRAAVPLPPVPVLAAAAESAGHVRVQLDADGVARSVWLREGPPGQAWDHMALALYRAGAGDVGLVTSNGDAGDRPWQHLPDDSSADWLAENRLIVPFPTTPVRHFPLVDVVAGLVPAEEFRNRYVLVGSTAPGVGNAFVTPVAGRDSLMAETDIVAAVLQSLLEQRYVQPASPRLNALVNALPALGAGLALAFLSTGAALAALGGLAVATLGATALLPVATEIQIYPLAGLLALLVAWPLWLCVRLFTAVRSLSAEMGEMDDSVFPSQQDAPPGSDMIERHIGRLHEAIEQLRSSQRLVADSLDSVPDVTLIVDGEGRVRIANAAALRYLRAAGVRDVVGTRMGDIGQSILPDDARMRVAALFTPEPAAEGRTEVIDRQGREFLLRVIPRTRDGLGGQSSEGWIVSLVDIHTVREAQKQRDDALRFISHDMRAPQSSIISLIELHQRGAEEAQDTARLLERIQRYARSALDMSEDFIQFARAEAGKIEPEPNDLHALLEEAADLVWPRARSRGIRIELPDDESVEAMAVCTVDRSLMTRALMNLLDNAIKFSPEGTTIHCEIAPEPALHPGQPPRWRVSVRDQGPGLPVSDTEILFEKFRRAQMPHAPRIEGAGLGLAFVRSVVQAHGGTLSALNCAEQGAEFRICLPANGLRGSAAPES